MKVPAKRTVEKILDRHRGKVKKPVKLTPQAASMALLYHWIFLKKLAKTCDQLAFSERKVQISEEMVTRATPGVLLSFNENERVRRRRKAREAEQSSKEDRSTTLITSLSVSGKQRS